MDVLMATEAETAGVVVDVAGGVDSCSADDVMDETLGVSDTKTVAGGGDDSSPDADAMEETLGGSEAAGMSPETLIRPDLPTESVSLGSPPSSDGDDDDDEDDVPLYRRRDKAPAQPTEEGLTSDDLELCWTDGPQLTSGYQEEPVCTCSGFREDFRRFWCSPRWRRPCPLHPRSRWEGFGPRGGGDTDEEEDEAPRVELPRIDSRIPTGVGAGLWNLGNTCFMNSILQCFTHTVPLVKALRSFSHDVPCGSEEFCVVCTLRDHIELSLASSGKIIEPGKFCKNIKNISSNFERGHQEDAHEFLTCFLDKLERSSLESTSSDKSPATKANNLVEQIFGGRLVSKLLCGNCGHCSESFEPLVDMSLEIADVNTLENVLDSFTKLEKIEDSTCENCKVQASMEKRLMIDKTPSVAALILKRFRSDGVSVEKIGKHVKFPLELDLKPYTIGHQDSSVEMKYQLYGFVVHRGFMPTDGHYFCYIRSAPHTWHKLDDSMVREVEEEEVLSEAPYILFYAREGTPWFSSLVEPQKLCTEFSDSNTSPKSVLDNMDDGKHTVYPGLCGADILNTKTTEEVIENTSMDFFRDTKHEGCSTRETIDDAAENTAGISLADEHFSPQLSCNDTTMADAVVPLREIDQFNEVEKRKFFASPPVRNDTSKEFNNLDSRNGGHSPIPLTSQREIDQFKVGKRKFFASPPVRNDTSKEFNNLDSGNGGHSAIPLTSLSPDSNSERLPGIRNTFPRAHLKTENRVNSKGSRSVPAMDPKKREALRYVSQSNMSKSRKMKFLAAMSPESDGKRRSRPSPRRKVFSPSSYSKLLRHMRPSDSPRGKLVRKIGFSGQ